MSDIQIIQVGESGSATAIPIEITPLPPGSGVEIPGASGATRLDELSDVDGADLGNVGDALVRQGDGTWRPAQVSGGGGTSGPLSHLHVQDEPSTVWFIQHGLSFAPSGIEVLDHVSERHYPQVSYPDPLTVRLDFDYPVRGTARLS